MKKFILSILVLVALGFQALAQDISPYIKIGETNETIQQAADKVVNTLKDNSFQVLGVYHPSNQGHMKVIAFTRSDIKNTVIKVEDRGALAAIFKVGIVKENETTTLSYTNPDYILRAYLRDSYATYAGTFEQFSTDLKTAFSVMGIEFEPFG